jgi:2-polyprenyl-6-methoxyphenol hydroxylase-like FAD-dependent oxidoreductase
MYPMGANGASQAILDAVALAKALEDHGEDIPAALEAYAAGRQGPTAEIVRSNRQYGPEAIIQIVDDRISGPDDRVEDVITQEEIERITLGYRKVAGFDVNELNRQAAQPSDDA